MSIGVLTSQLAHALECVDVLRNSGKAYVAIGPYRQYCLTRPPYGAINLSGLFGGVEPLVDLAPLGDHDVGLVVNFGNLESLLCSALASDVGAGIDAPGASQQNRDSRTGDARAQAAYDRASATLHTCLAKAELKLEWLANLSRQEDLGLHIELGQITKARPTVPKDALAGALRRARRSARLSRYSTVWIDPITHPRGVSSHDIAGALQIRRPFQRYAPIAFLLAEHVDHCPLDPPMLTEALVGLAAEYHLGGIVIDAAHGVIINKERTIAAADRFGVPILAV